MDSGGGVGERVKRIFFCRLWGELVAGSSWPETEHVVVAEREEGVHLAN